MTSEQNLSSGQKLMPQEGKKYRLITRSDMDGLVCAVILKELGYIEEILFAHPRDMQHQLIEVSENDITANLPYVPGVYMCFDHHASEAKRVDQQTNHVINADAPSAANVIYNYFGGTMKPKLNNITSAMMEAVDKADAAQFSRDDILNPQGWELLSFIMDARTGLGRFRQFEISNYELMTKLVDYCREHQDINTILELPDVKERVDLYMEHKSKFEDQIQKCSRIHKNLIVLDLRDEHTIWAGNRFVIYALFPQCNISMHVIWGKNKQSTVLAVGKSILNRTSPVHIGDLMLQHGGGGHAAAGTCQVDNDKASEIIQQLVAELKK